VNSVSTHLLAVPGHYDERLRYPSAHITNDACRRLIVLAADLPVHPERRGDRLRVAMKRPRAIYDRVTQKWRQTCVDTRGALYQYSDELTDGKMVDLGQVPLSPAVHQEIDCRTSTPVGSGG